MRDYSTAHCAQRALANLAGHETVIIKDAGHWVHHDQLEVFMSHVERFLAE